MVFFALTRSGYEDFERYLGARPDIALWVNKGVMSPTELMQVRATGLSVTIFTRKIDAFDGTSVDEAVNTIREHHPSESIWIER